MRIPPASRNNHISLEYYAARHFTAPFAHMNVYLPYLEREIEDLRVDVKLAGLLRMQRELEEEEVEGDEMDGAWDLSCTGVVCLLDIRGRCAHFQLYVDRGLAYVW